MAKKDSASMPVEKKLTTSDKVSKFIQKYRVLFIVLFCVILVGLVAYAIVDSKIEKNLSRELAKIEKIEKTLLDNSSDLSESELNTRLTEALSSLEKYIGKPGVIGMRAEYLKAEVLYMKKDFKSASDSYLKVASKSKGTYLSPLCYFNAASSLEEINDIDKALEYYQIAADDKEFLDPNHALFLVARIKEAKLDYDGAKEKYEKIISKEVKDSWANLAKSRLLVLENEGKISK